MTPAELHDLPQNDAVAEPPEGTHAPPPPHHDHDPQHAPPQSEAAPGARGRVAVAAGGGVLAGALAGFLVGRRTAARRSLTPRQLRHLRRRALIGTAKRAPKVALATGRGAWRLGHAGR